MSWDGAHYETRSVRAFRGSEAKKIAAWEADGWELVAQPASGLTTELYFRRIKKVADGAHVRTGPRRNLLLVGAAAVLAVLVVVVVTRGGDPAPAAAAPAAAPTSTPSSTDAAADEPLTVGSSVDLTALMSDPDSCSADVADFASTYTGRSITVDSTVAATAARPGGRYDVLVLGGDKGVKPVLGPKFALQGVTVADLHLAPAGGRDYVTTGDDITLTAQVDSYDAKACLVHLVPLATAVR